MRAEFANTRPQGGTWALIPGMYARVRLPVGERHKALCVIDKAIGSDQGLKFVYVVDAEDKVQYRRVTTGPLQGGWVAGDRRRPEAGRSGGGRCVAVFASEDGGAGGGGGDADRDGGGTDAVPQEAPAAAGGREEVRGPAVISRYFIDRPIFATVLSAVVTLAGTIALAYLPVAQYPRITPPGIVISISYPGASAQEVADTVGAPIEQQVNGVEGMLYMSSQSGNDGTYSLTVTFDIGTDLNSALVKVQNRVALAMPLLPSPVQNQGITVRKKTPDLLLIVSTIPRTAGTTTST